MENCLYINSEENNKKLKIKARRAVNAVVLAYLISSVSSYAFSILTALLLPYFSELISAILLITGNSPMYIKAYVQNFMQSDEFNWFISIINTILCSFVPFAFVSSKVFHLDWNEVVPVKGKISRHLPFIYCASLMMSGVASGVAGGIFSFIFPDAYSRSATGTVEIYGTSSTPYSLVLAFLAMCVVAPFVEEFIYRGVMFCYFRKFGFTFAAFSSSLIFGLGHPTVEQIAYAFVFGLVLSFVTEKTGNIKSAVIIHFINNFIGYISAYILPLCGSDNALIVFDTVYGLVVGVFAVIGMIAIFKNRVMEKDKETQNAPISSFFGIGAVLVFALSIVNILLGLM